MDTVPKFNVGDVVLLKTGQAKRVEGWATLDGRTFVYKVNSANDVRFWAAQSILRPVEYFDPRAFRRGDIIRIVALVQKGPYPLRTDTLRRVEEVTPRFIIATALEGFTKDQPQAFSTETCRFFLAVASSEYEEGASPNS